MDFRKLLKQFLILFAKQKQNAGVITAA